MKTIWKGIKFLGKAYIDSYTSIYGDLIKRGVNVPFSVGI